jgi:hypothetical protein
MPSVETEEDAHVVCLKTGSTADTPVQAVELEFVSLRLDRCFFSGPPYVIRETEEYTHVVRPKTGSTADPPVQAVEVEFVSLRCCLFSRPKYHSKVGVSGWIDRPRQQRHAQPSLVDLTGSAVATLNVER